MVDGKVRIIRAMHEANVGGGHFGRDKTYTKVAERYFWDGIYDDVSEFISTCNACQRVNPRLNRSAEPLHPMPVTNKAWHTIGVDLVDPLHQTPDGNRYIVVAVDLFSKWPEAQGIPNKNAGTINSFILSLVCRHGVSKILVSDQGREFVNELNGFLMSSLGTNHRVASACHPQTNGQVEGFNQTLKNSLMKVVIDNGDD